MRKGQVKDPTRCYRWWHFSIGNLFCHCIDFCWVSSILRILPMVNWEVYDWSMRVCWALEGEGAKHKSSSLRRSRGSQRIVRLDFVLHSAVEVLVSVSHLFSMWIVGWLLLQAVVNLENQVNVDEVPCHCMDLECRGSLEDLFEICTTSILLPFIAQGHDLDQNWILFSMAVL